MNEDFKRTLLLVAASLGEEIPEGAEVVYFDLDQGESTGCGCCNTPATFELTIKKADGKWRWYNFNPYTFITEMHEVMKGNGDGQAQQD